MVLCTEIDRQQSVGHWPWWKSVTCFSNGHMVIGFEYHVRYLRAILQQLLIMVCFRLKMLLNPSDLEHVSFTSAAGCARVRTSSKMEAQCVTPAYCVSELSTCNRSRSKPSEPAGDCLFDCNSEERTPERSNGEVISLEAWIVPALACIKPVIISSSLCSRLCASENLDPPSCSLALS